MWVTARLPILYTVFVCGVFVVALLSYTLCGSQATHFISVSLDGYVVSVSLDGYVVSVSLDGYIISVSLNGYIISDVDG